MVVCHVESAISNRDENLAEVLSVQKAPYIIYQIVLKKQKLDVSFDS